MVVFGNHNDFCREDIKNILKNRFIVFIGDSNQRNIYKDFVLLIQQDRLLSESELRSKGDYKFLSDELIEGGRKGEMTNGIDYREVRQYQTKEHLVRFYFVTRCHNAYMESILSDLSSDLEPDLVVMNSCLWDISRYGKSSVDMYKENLDVLMTRLKETLPSNCLMIWATTLPISSNARGGFLVPKIEFLSATLRLDILEANFYATTVANKYGFDVLDLHFYLRHYLHQQVKDGVHWDMMAHRYITNLIMSHVVEAWGIHQDNVRRPAPYGSVAGQQRVYKENINQYHTNAWNQQQNCQQIFGEIMANFDDRYQIQPLMLGASNGQREPVWGGPAHGAPVDFHRGPPTRSVPPAAREPRAHAPPSAAYYDFNGSQQGYSRGGYGSGYGTYKEGYGQESHYDYGQSAYSRSNSAYKVFSDSWAERGVLQTKMPSSRRANRRNPYTRL